MKQQEIEERNFTTDEKGKILDDAGNEYRNENGSIEYKEKD